MRIWSHSLVKKTFLSFSLLSFPMDCIGSDVLQLCTESSGYAEFFLKDNKKMMELKCFSFEEKWHCEAKVVAGTEAALKTCQRTTQAKLRRIFYFQDITFCYIQESGILVHIRVKIGYDPLIFFLYYLRISYTRNMFSSDLCLIFFYFFLHFSAHLHDLYFIPTVAAGCCH